MDAFANGDDEPLAKLWSHADDVTLGNPFGPFVRGFEQVAETMKRAAANYQEGHATGFDQLAKHVAEDFASSRWNGSARSWRDATISRVVLRCTSIFRREGGSWKLVHRHADPINTPQTAESVIQG